ncbi:MAG: hypothetical protein SH809_15765, partial [Rhodothermales bacterium]|nr:hypothetical protein [Rhodothermales bacterium]
LQLANLQLANLQLANLQLANLQLANLQLANLQPLPPRHLNNLDRRAPHDRRHDVGAEPHVECDAQAVFSERDGKIDRKVPLAVFGFDAVEAALKVEVDDRALKRHRRLHTPSGLGGGGRFTRRRGEEENSEKCKVKSGK